MQVSALLAGWHVNQIFEHGWLITREPKALELESWDLAQISLYDVDEEQNRLFEISIGKRDKCERRRAVLLVFDMTRVALELNFMLNFY